jgi:hypothetical protein
MKELKLYGTKTIRIEGITYNVRYTYKRDDGTLWYVLADAEGLYGEYGDEWPVSQTANL